jgi:phosphate uptake regulator
MSDSMRLKVCSLQDIELKELIFIVQVVVAVRNDERIGDHAG